MGASSIEEGRQEMHPTKLPFLRRNNPFVQNLLVSACLFFNPGLYLAITLLGAGGGRPSSVIMADTSNGVLYGVFAFSAVFASTMLNTVGPRPTMLFAITGYPLYTGSMWYFDAYGHLWFPVFTGAYLGLSAGCLWTTAAFVGNAYPEEKDKGTWRAIQWSSNIAGATVGGCVALGINWNATTLGVPHSVYIIFIVLQCASLGFAMLLLPPQDLVRPDGTHIASFERVSVKESLGYTAKLFADWRILVMIPVFFTPEMFFPLQSSINAYAFSLRTRSLNAVLGSFIQIPTSVAMGYILDNEKFGRRKTRAFIGIGIDVLWITGAYIAQTVWLSSWKFDRSVEGPSIDVSDAAYPGAIIIYLFFAAQYGIFQNVVIWLFGTLTNSPQRQAAIGGLFVGLLSAGTAVSFGTDATAQPYENENAAYFALTMLCWPIMFFVAWKATLDTNYFLEETVIVPVHIREQIQEKVIFDGNIHGGGDNKLNKKDETLADPMKE
ncbi:hypothetical protein F5884DRAFT_799458 [Xylogone sp. PMI_703]|nr:hypothetical protein F5884DRAFT_799458 [Xylogone sp. PMI_703]